MVEPNKPVNDERLLLESLKRNDERTWTRFCAAHRDQVLRFCRGILRNHDEAEDVTQEVFYRAAKSIGSFRGDSKLSTWLLTIAERQSINRLKSPRRNREVSSEDHWLGAIDNQPMPNEALEEKEAVLAYEHVLGELDVLFRGPFILREVEGLSYKEIAEVTKIPIATVKTRIFRAREYLYERLKDHRG